MYRTLPAAAVALTLCFPAYAQEQTEVEGVKYDLEGYFHEVVIGGPGAFTVVTETPEDFPRAIANKLVLEIAGGPARTPLLAAR